MKRNTLQPQQKNPMENDDFSYVGLSGVGVFAKWLRG
jgi:hypothetical protein